MYKNRKFLLNQWNIGTRTQCLRGKGGGGGIGGEKGGWGSGWGGGDILHKLSK